MIYKRPKTKNHWTSILIMLIILIVNTGNILAQENSGNGDLEEISSDNIQDIQLLHWFGQGSYTGRIAQQKNGSLLAALTTSGIALLNSENGEQTGFISVGLGPSALSISPDGSTLAIVVNYPTGELGRFAGLPKYDRQIQLYSLPSGERKGETIQNLGECADSNIWDIAFTPDGSELVFEKKYGVNDDIDIRKFCVVSLTENKVTQTLELPQSSIMAISPKGDYVAAIKKQSDKISIYATTDFSMVQELTFPMTDWPELMFSPSGRAVAVRILSENGQESQTLLVWNLRDGKLVYSGEPVLPHNQDMDQNDMIMSFEITQDEGTIFLGTQFGYVLALNTKTGKTENQSGPFTWINYVLTGNPGGETSFETSAMVKTILLCADERTLIASEDLTTYGQSGSIHVFQIPAGKEIFKIQGTSAGSDNLGIAFSPDSSQIALVGSNDGRVEIYNTQDGQVVMELVGHTQAVNQVAFSPNGNIIATCSNDKTTRLWNAQTGSSIKTLSGHQGRVNRIAFSPDSSWIISGADDNTLRRWDVKDGQLLETLALGDENWRVDLLDILNDNKSVVYRISKYPSPYIGYIQKQILWNTQNSDSKNIGGSNTNITQFATGKELFSGYSDSGRITGSLNADGSMMITSTFRSPYGNGALALPAIAPNHQLVVAGNGFGLQTWDLSGDTINFLGLAAASQPVPSYGNEYIFSQDGKYLAFTSGGVAYLMGVETE